MTIDSCRIKILEELKDTEKTYVSQLGLVYNVNITPFFNFFFFQIYLFIFILEYCKESC